MAVSGLHFENSLVGSEWATAVLLCTNGLRKQSFMASSCQLSAVTIASLLMHGCVTNV